MYKRKIDKIKGKMNDDFDKYWLININVNCKYLLQK